jgi:hypothetical protein
MEHPLDDLGDDQKTATQITLTEKVFGWLRGKILPALAPDSTKEAPISPGYPPENEHEFMGSSSSPEPLASPERFQASPLVPMHPGRNYEDESEADLDPFECDPDSLDPVAILPAEEGKYETIRRAESNNNNVDADYSKETRDSGSSERQMSGSDNSDSETEEEPSTAIRANFHTSDRTWANVLMRKMMFVSGENAEPSVDTTALVEQIVKQQVQEMVCSAYYSFSYLILIEL